MAIENKQSLIEKRCNDYYDNQFFTQYPYFNGFEMKQYT